MNYKGHDEITVGCKTIRLMFWKTTVQKRRMDGREPGMKAGRLISKPGD